MVRRNEHGYCNLSLAWLVFGAMSTPTPLEKAVSLLGGQRGAARLLGVSPGMVWQWLNGRRPLPPEHCGLLESATAEQGDAVTAEELLPEITFQRDGSGRVVGYLTPVRQPDGDIDPDADRVGPAVETA